MEITSQSSPPQDPKEQLASLARRLRALELQVCGQSGRFEASAPDGRPGGPTDLSDDLEYQRERLRDCEKALVERIADVDDERRAIASRLQRAWQSKQEEIDKGLRHHARLLAGLLTLFTILFIGALVFVYRQAATGQSRVAEDVLEIRRELAQLSRGQAIAEQLQEKLDRLTVDVGGLAAAIEKADQGREQGVRAAVAAERAAREQGESARSEEIRRLHAEQEHLVQELASLRSDLQALTTGGHFPEGAGQASATAADTGAVAGDMAVAEAPKATGADAASGAGPAGEGPDAASAENSDGAPDEGTGAAEVEDGTGRAGEEADAANAEDSDGPPGERVGTANAEDGTGRAGAEKGATLSPPAETLIAGGDIYALQLIGFSSRKSLEKFMARQGLPAQVYTIRQTYKGRPWYAVIAGLYDDYAAAEEALSRLPPDLVALKPWIRPLSQVTELHIVETGSKQE